MQEESTITFFKWRLFRLYDGWDYETTTKIEIPSNTSLVVGTNCQFSDKVSFKRCISFSDDDFYLVACSVVRGLISKDWLSYIRVCIPSPQQCNKAYKTPKRVSGKASLHVLYTVSPQSKVQWAIDGKTKPPWLKFILHSAVAYCYCRGWQIREARLVWMAPCAYTTEKKDKHFGWLGNKGRDTKVAFLDECLSDCKCEGDYYRLFKDLPFNKHGFERISKDIE